MKIHEETDWLERIKRAGRFVQKQLQQAVVSTEVAASQLCLIS
jgi:hypothetical protein